jgi:type I restriction enzyme S subunit
VKAEWRSVTVGDILWLEYGKPLPNAKRVDDGRYPIYGANGVKGRTNRCYYDRSSIIVGRKGSAGELNLSDGGFWPLDVTYFVKLRGEDDLKFVWYLLTRLNLPSLAKGVKPGINRNEVYSIPVSIPSKKEQERIVAILDKAFEGIATAKTNIEQNKQNVQRFLSEYRERAFETKDRDWDQKSLGETCILRSGTTLPKQLERDTGEIPYLKVADMNLNENRDGITSSSRYVAQNSINQSNLLPTGTTIFPKRGGAILTNKKRLTTRVICADLNIMGVTPRNQILPEYLFNYFLQLDLRMINNGSSIPQINNYSIEPLLIRFPKSLAEQRAVVTKISSIASGTQALVSAYDRRLSALEELKQSLLHQAFTGKL